MVSRYVTNGPVKQEGVCLVPQHPQHYRMLPQPQRTDGYHVSTPPAYVQQPPPNQVNNQVPPLRGMPPTGPPTQASTPPNSDLKVQMPPQPMNITYVSQMPVRGPAQGGYTRAPQPNTQSSRMANHRQGQQQHMFPTQAQAQYVNIAMQPSVPFLNSSPYFAGPQPRPQPSFVTAAPFQMLSGFSYQPAQTQPAYFYNSAQLLQRPQMSSMATGPPNPTPPPPTQMPLPQPPQPIKTLSSRKRKHALAVIDPNTGKNRLDEIYEQDDSHPPSGESSARQTPQPPLLSTNKEVQAAFARQVTEAIKDEEICMEYDSASVMDPMGNLYSLPPQTVPHQRFDTIAQNSKLQAATKEFFPSVPHNPAKETTPVVSAITDAVEVTIPNKPKDRESPVKGRKPREPTNIVKEPVIEKEDVTICEKPDNVNKEEIKIKDSIATNIMHSKEPVVTTADKNNLKKEASKPAPASVPTPVAVVEENKAENDVPDVVPPTNVDSSESNAKSKQASTKTKELPKQPQVQTSQQLPHPQQHASPTQTPPQPLPVSQKVLHSAPPPVPVTQPMKPNNKTNKLKEINLKGALKEGTDMDAFNDNTEDIIVTTDYVNSDYVNNDNSTILNNNEDANKNNDITTIKPIIETKAKSKFDVMDIVKDTPKPIKPLSVPTAVESSDEVDRAALANEKLVQAKNEANTKASAEIIETNPPESKLSLPYKEDQWSPYNPDGKKVYDYEFLMSLKNNPKSKIKPDNIHPDILANDTKGRMGDINRYPVGGRQTDFAPNFGNNVYANKNSSQRGGALVKRKSQQGVAGGANKTGSRPSLIRVSISVKEDVKLKEVENAWRPARFTAGENMTDEEKKTADLYKKVRGVLNKLTPQKFSQLLEQVKLLQIDTSDRLQGVIDLVFEKAVDEPNFSVAYANLCKELSLMQVPTGDKKKDKDGQPAEFVNFRKLLVTRCQMEFEKNSVDEKERNEKLKEIEQCEDPEKKKEMQLDLEEYDRRLRMKSVGNIRFIGELFKQNMLTSNIMLRCLNNLLANKDEENLECLCKLMSTIGKELEARKIDLTAIFTVMKEIVDKKHGKISSRVRFMIQDVIDLRQSQWVPRRQDFNPKTMDQIQKEAESEQLAIHVMNAMPITPRRDDRLVGSGGSTNPNNERRNRKNVSSDDSGWSQPRNSRGQTLNIQSDKLKTVMPMNDEPLGNSAMFGSWSSGSNIKPQASLATSNIYSALENLSTEGDKKAATNMRPHSKDHYNSKGLSLERNYRQSYEDGHGSRSGSQHRSRDSSASQHYTPQIPVQQAPLIPPTYVPPPSVPASVPPKEQLPDVEMSSDEIQTQLKKILEDYSTDFDINECDKDFKKAFPTSVLPRVVTEGYNSVLERSKTARWYTGQLFARLITLGTLSVESYCIGLTEVLSVATDLIIDIPKLWDYLGELIAPVLCEGVISMNDLYNCSETLISQNHASKLLVSIFNLIIHEKCQNFLHSIWTSSGLSLSHFMPESQVDNFVKDNQFEFLLQKNYTQSPVCKASNLSQEEIHKKLLDFFKSNTSFDDTVNWITANVGEGVTQNHFIRTLATACFQDSIVQSKFKLEIFKVRYHLLLRYVDAKPEYELQCLYALQALIQKLQHPPGLLLAIFDKIYEENLFSHESFIAWEQSTDPAEQEGKGVALKQLTSFYTQLKEAEDDDSCGSSEETGG